MYDERLPCVQTPAFPLVIANVCAGFASSAPVYTFRTTDEASGAQSFTVSVPFHPRSETDDASNQVSIRELSRTAERVSTSPFVSVIFTVNGPFAAYASFKLSDVIILVPETTETDTSFPFLSYTLTVSVDGVTSLYAIVIVSTPVISADCSPIACFVNSLFT